MLSVIDGSGCMPRLLCHFRRYHFTCPNALHKITLIDQVAAGFRYIGKAPALPNSPLESWRKRLAGRVDPTILVTVSVGSQEQACLLPHGKMTPAQ